MLANAGSRNAQLGGNSGGPNNGLNRSQKLVSSNIDDKVADRSLKTK